MLSVSNTLRSKCRRVAAKAKPGTMLWFILAFSLFAVLYLFLPRQGEAVSDDDDPEPAPITGGRVLVTGGLGFIGSHVVEMLLEQNFSVCIAREHAQQSHQQQLGLAIAGDCI